MDRWVGTDGLVFGLLLDLLHQVSTPILHSQPLDLSCADPWAVEFYRARNSTFQCRRDRETLQVIKVQVSMSEHYRLDCISSPSRNSLNTQIFVVAPEGLESAVWT